MTEGDASPSARKTELLEAAYRYALQHGLTDLSLRPLAAAVGSSPRVLLYLFGSKENLVRALLTRARRDELDLLRRAVGPGSDGLVPLDPAADDVAPTDLAGDDLAATDLAAVAERVWSWLAAPEHRLLLTLWLEAYARSLVEPEGPWADFAHDTVSDWLAVLSGARRPDPPRPIAPPTVPPTMPPAVPTPTLATAVLAILRGGLLDLLATGETDRVTAAVRKSLAALLATTTGETAPPEARPTPRPHRERS